MKGRYRSSANSGHTLDLEHRPAFGLDTSVYLFLLFRVANSINVLMLFDQIGGSFELAKQIAEVFLNFFVGYVPRSAFYCILMVSLIKTILCIILFLIFSRMKFLFSVFCSRSYRNLQLLLWDIFGLLKILNQRIK